ncbi:hypothetical protein HNP38_003297 [Chryseobacterium defluvii]|uniref:Uncharacterized protein n=1 Tax=Chryseobacterium defluvii TaxID=160396 RepID=A0A840KJ59_9FLAO|nr:hypothetical protein [Chryseobacterium defluvii]MBB4807957.1 hypothetical protein [Chryseobacterium defluvii]
MKNFKTTIFVFLLLFIQNLNAQTEVKGPKEFFTILFDTFVKNDPISLKNLNDYSGQFMDEENIYVVDNESKDDYLKGFLDAFPENTVTECKKEAEEFFNAINENFKNGKLNIKSIKHVKNERADMTTVEIIYSVKFKVPSRLSDFEFEDPESIKPDRLKNFLIQAIKELKNADKIVTTEDEETILYQREKEGKTFYFSLSGDRIVSELQRFYFYSLGKESFIYQ